MTSTYETPAEAAKAIRQQIKCELGLTARQVSVRSDSYSMGSSIDVRIKTAEAAKHFDRIEQIASGKESVSRCEVTHEILNGGNRYVHVEIAQSATEAKIEADGINEALESVTDNTVRKIAGCRVWLCSHSGRLQVMGPKDEFRQEAWDAPAAAEIIARKSLLQAGAEK